MNDGRDREIVRLFLAGTSPAAIGRRFDLTERTVFRIAQFKRGADRRAA
jgi:DNA-binding CsgD family transcriptional regulator